MDFSDTNIPPFFFQNAVQAVQLVAQAQADPQPFLGRYLRYENARARRSLWVSYRTPVHFMQCASQDGKLGAYMHSGFDTYFFILISLYDIEEGADVVVDDNGVKGRWIESDLPDALRIWKPRDARSVLAAPGYLPSLTLSYCFQVSNCHLPRRSSEQWRCLAL